jgi:hypothetical protein
VVAEAALAAAVESVATAGAVEADEAASALSAQAPIVPKSRRNASVPRAILLVRNVKIGPRLLEGIGSVLTDISRFPINCNAFTL